jgi:hypothetical protein
MDERKINRLADDVHLVTIPVRVAADWIKILLFLLAVPIVFIVSIVHWVFTGKPIMSPDEIWLTKLLLTVFSPFITTIICLFHKHSRRMKEPDYMNPIPAPIVFIITLVLMLGFVKSNFYFGWGLYDLPHLR